VGYLACLHCGGGGGAVDPHAPAAELERELEVVEPAVVLRVGQAGASTRCARAGADVVSIDVDGLPGRTGGATRRRGRGRADVAFTSGRTGGRFAEGGGC
jgi:hypothetical protein